MTKTNKVTILEKDGEPEFAILPIDEYNRLVADAVQTAEDVEDILGYHHTRGDEIFPAELVEAVLARDRHSVALFREYRGLTAAALAEAAGVTASYLSEIENRKKPGSATALLKIARALDVGLELIVESDDVRADEADPPALSGYKIVRGVAVVGRGDLKASPTTKAAKEKAAGKATGRTQRSGTGKIV